MPIEAHHITQVSPLVPARGPALWPGLGAATSYSMQSLLRNATTPLVPADLYKEILYKEPAVGSSKTFDTDGECLINLCMHATP